MILTTRELSGFISTALEEDDLQVLLDAAEREIVRAAGPSGSVTELFYGGSHRIVLSAQAESITSITETVGSSVTTFDPADYLLDPGGYIVLRLGDGPHGGWSWCGRVAVTYAKVDDDGLRKGVQLDLVKLMLSYQPGVTQETIGAWSQSLASNSVWNQDVEREAILSRLSDGPSLIVVGG